MDSKEHTMREALDAFYDQIAKEMPYEHGAKLSTMEQASFMVLVLHTMGPLFPSDASEETQHLIMQGYLRGAHAALSAMKHIEDEASSFIRSADPDEDDTRQIIGRIQETKSTMRALTGLPSIVLGQLTASSWARDKPELIADTSDDYEKDMNEAAEGMHKVLKFFAQEWIKHDRAHVQKVVDTATEAASEANNVIGKFRTKKT
jgi:hypothetical protein